VRGVTAVLQVEPGRQSSVLKHTVVQRNVPEAAVVSTHLESEPGANPQSWSFGVLEVEAQLVELYWLRAVQVVTARSVQRFAVSLSMLRAFDCTLT
jgi:hypothetical protein